MKPQKGSALIMQSRVVKRTTFFISALFFMGLSVLLAADFWETKDYSQWSDKECAKLLQESPWAMKYELIREGNVTPTEGSGAKSGPASLGSSEGSGGQSYVKYFFRLQSALPIRMAQVRQMQIANKYDSLPAEQKQAFDKSAESFLAADYGDKIVLNVNYSTNVQSLDLELSRYWQSKTTAVFNNSVFLIPGKGEKIKLMDFKVAPGAQREFQLIFSRESNGVPILSDQDKSLTVEFMYPVVDFSRNTVGGSMGEGRGLVEFKVKKMMIKGCLVY
jgi:hypothetical protein